MLHSGRGQDLTPNLTAICDVTERMGRITSQLKTFARRRTEDVQSVALDEAVANARMLIEYRLAAEGVDCQVQVDAGLRAQADPTRLEQVLLNLMANALDAMRGCDRRQLRVRCEAQGAQDSQVRVSIADTGQGMDDAALARLYEPFFTTKPPGEGLGLGLVISSKIVREFGGTLNARRGATGMIFEFDLARSTAPADHV
jgi:two-component system C4-dicarboxylate transport sensor histidine kinase DctB